MRPSCAGQSDLFFSEAEEAIEVARRLCNACPLRQECARRALALIDQRALSAGVWAGVVVTSRPGHQRRALEAVAGGPINEVVPVPPPSWMRNQCTMPRSDILPDPDRYRVFHHRAMSASPVA